MCKGGLELPFQMSTDNCYSEVVNQDCTFRACETLKKKEYLYVVTPGIPVSQPSVVTIKVAKDFGRPTP